MNTHISNFKDQIQKLTVKQEKRICVRLRPKHTSIYLKDSCSAGVLKVFSIGRVFL